MSISSLDDVYLQLERGNTGDAIPPLEHLVATWPTYVTPHVLLARAYETQARWEEAQSLWQRAHFLMPNSPAVRQGLQRATKARSGASSASPRDRPQAGDAPDSEPMENVPADRAQEQETLTTREPTEASLGGELELSEEARQAAPLVGTERVENLDHLIGELQKARIRPEPDLDDIPTPDLDDEIEDVVSETLARIYVAQKQYGEAAYVYEQLATQEPDRADEFHEKATQMQRRADEAQ